MVNDRTTTSCGGSATSCGGSATSCGGSATSCGGSELFDEGSLLLVVFPLDTSSNPEKNGLLLVLVLVLICSWATSFAWGDHQVEAVLYTCSSSSLPFTPRRLGEHVAAARFLQGH